MRRTVWLALALSAAATGMGCSLVRPVPSFGPDNPGHEASEGEIKAAAARANTALISCARTYATENAAAAASAGDVADASVSHCSLELTAIDIADREFIRHAQDVARFRYGSPGISPTEAEQRVAQMHDDAAHAARGLALETVIALRNPGH